MFLQLLTVQHESASAVMNALRSVFWFLAKGTLILLDGMFSIIEDIWKFKFFDNDYVKKIYSAAIIVACTWLILKVIIEIIMHYFINQDDNSSPTRVFKGVIFSIAMMFLIPPIFNWGFNLSSRMTQYVISASSTADISPGSLEATMSSMILTAFADDSKMTKEDQKYFVEKWFTVDYNEVTNDGLLDSGEYKYSFHTFSIFLIGLIVLVLLMFIGIQVAKRVIELALYKAIAPFVCTSLISIRSHAFEVWVKGVMGAFLVTAVQYLCIGILFNVFGSVIQGTENPLSVVIIVIGVLLFIVSSPQLISTLLNANTGTLSNMSELHSLTAIGTSMLALSKYGSSSDNSISNSQTNNNSSENGDVTSSGSDPNINTTSNTSNLDSATNSNNTNSSISDDSISSNNMSEDSSYVSSNSTVSSDLSNMMNEDINTGDVTSLSDRLDTYFNMIDNNFSSYKDNTSSYKTNADWSDLSVFNSKKY